MWVRGFFFYFFRKKTFLHFPSSQELGSFAHGKKLRLAGELRRRRKKKEKKEEEEKVNPEKLSGRTSSINQRADCLLKEANFRATTSATAAVIYFCFCDRR